MDIIKENGSKILYDYGLLKELNKYGKSHIVGSYKMDLMVWNDLDIDIENENICMKNVYSIMRFIFNKYLPIWFEGKQTKLNNKKCYFIGFETNILVPKFSNSIQKWQDIGQEIPSHGIIQVQETCFSVSDRLQ